MGTLLKAPAGTKAVSVDGTEHEITDGLVWAEDHVVADFLALGFAHAPDDVEEAPAPAPEKEEEKPTPAPEKPRGRGKK